MPTVFVKRKPAGNVIMFHSCFYFCLVSFDFTLQVGFYSFIFLFMNELCYRQEIWENKPLKLNKWLISTELELDNT